MNLPFRKRTTAQPNPIIPEMNGPVQPVSGPTINWPRLILAVVAGLIILGALIWGGVWTADRLTDQPKKVATTSQPAKTGSPKQSSNPSKPGSSTDSNASGPTASPNTTPQAVGDQQQSQTQNQPASGNLTNSGPGDVAAVFLITALTGAGLYHYILRKRLA